MASPHSMSMWSLGFTSAPYLMQGFFKAAFRAEFWPQSQWKNGLYFPKKVDKISQSEASETFSNFSS